VEARLVEFKTQEIKFCEKIRGLEFDVKNKNTKIERITNELQQIKKEKEVLFLPPAQVYSPPKKDISFTRLPEFANDTITDYSRPSPSIEILVYCKDRNTYEGTKILATIDGKPRTIFESSIRRNLKLNDEEGISSLPDAELFKNLAQMGPKSTYFNEFSNNIATAVGEGSGTLTKPYHTPSLEAQQSPHHDLSSSLHPSETTEIIPTSIPTEIPTLRQYSRRATRITQSKALPTAAYEHASLLKDDSQGEAFPTFSGLEAGQDRENIIKTSALPHDSTPRVTSLDAAEGNLEISNLKARIKILKDKDKGSAELFGDDAPIKGRSLETGEEPGVERSTKRGILTVSLVPTSSGLVPTVSAIFTTASVVTPYSRRKEEELQMLIDGLDRNNEVIAKHIQEYEQSAAELTIGKKIDLINELVKYQDHHSKILKYQAQQSKLLFKKQQREFYMSVLRSHSGWKTKHFKGITLEEIKE
nr:hypothetical protein [Tanacetum cinerariifolium]